MPYSNQLLPPTVRIQEGSSISRPPQPGDFGYIHDNFPAGYNPSMKRAFIHGTPSWRLLRGLQENLQLRPGESFSERFTHHQTGIRVRLADRTGSISQVNEDGRNFQITFDDGQVSFMDLSDSNKLAITPSPLDQR